MLSSMELLEGGALATALLIALGTFIRACVSVNGYSGEAKPPMYGDLEAQRHWMEITTNLPIQEWYVQSDRNDLLYWGLDYPPLTAYFSWVWGKLAQIVYPALVQLNESRGIHTAEAITFLRASVIISDLCIFIPAALYFAWIMHKKVQPIKITSAINDKTTWTIVAAVLVFQPSLLVVDHGHFQYNGVSLGLALAAIAAFYHKKYMLTAFSFTLSLNYKQMELYHAPAFFAMLLGACLATPQEVIRLHAVKIPHIFHCILAIISVGIVVIFTFAINWLPFCAHADNSAECVEALVAVTRRMFPFDRSIFEDKVANFWCLIDPYTKYRAQIYAEKERMDAGVHLDAPVRSKVAFTCMATTLLAMLPSFIMLLIHEYRSLKLHTGARLPSSRIAGTLFGMLGISLSFFLFSYQVHEKTILLCVLPAACLYMYYPAFSSWFCTVAALSMWPLLGAKDNLTIPLYVCSAVFAYLTWPQSVSATPDRKDAAQVCMSVSFIDSSMAMLSDALRWGCWLACLSVVGVHLASAILSPPPSLPDLFPYISSVLCCLLFLISLGICWINQLSTIISHHPQRAKAHVE